MIIILAKTALLPYGPKSSSCTCDGLLLKVRIGCSRSDIVDGKAGSINDCVRDKGNIGDDTSISNIVFAVVTIPIVAN